MLLKESRIFRRSNRLCRKNGKPFRMRSVKALSLFNQVVGVKVLEDLNEFIRTNMLEEQDAEEEFIQLKESF